MPVRWILPPGHCWGISGGDPSGAGLTFWKAPRCTHYEASRCMKYVSAAARAADRYAPAAHTLTEDLLPTTCVVVNKPSALKHFPTTGAAPRPSESRSRVPRNRRSAVPLHVAFPRIVASTGHEGMTHIPVPIRHSFLTDSFVLAQLPWDVQRRAVTFPCTDLLSMPGSGIRLE